MNIEQFSPDREGDPWQDKEQIRKEGYEDSLKKSRKILEEDEKAKAKQERINKTAREALEKLNKMNQKKTSEPEQSNMF